MAEYRIDDLAREAGTTVRNVRVYQDRGLLPPPRREGRAGIYSDVLVQDEGLAEVVRAQVTSSVAWTDVRRLEPRGKVRVVARRVPGQDALLWQTVWLDGTDAADPLLQAQADELVAALRGTIG